MLKLIKRMRKRIKRLTKRLRKHGGGPSWKKTPSAWLVYFRATATLPVVFAGALVAYLACQLLLISAQHGLDGVGMVLWGFSGLLGIYVWIVRRVIRRCDELLYRRWFS